MLSFKHVELAEKYGVSEATVRKWIARTKAGKLNLILVDTEGMERIANTASNLAIMEKLAVHNKKFRNTKAAKTVTPRPEFYRLYNQAQIYDIVTNLEMHHEIPRQYNYFDGGADNWDKYVQRLVSEGKSSHDTVSQPIMTARLFERNWSYFDSLLANYERINVVDIGAGNVLPVKGLLSHLLGQGKLGRYIALDISPAMLRIARRNIKSWFGNKVDFEEYEADINYERFGNLLAEEILREESTANLILFLGGTPGNFRNPDGAFRMIHDSMQLNDFLVYTDKLDTDESRRYFDWNVEPGATKLAPNHRFIFDLLNIDPSYYDLEMGFDEKLRQRFVRVRLNVSLAIRFKFDTGERLLEFDKGETILLLRVWAVTPDEVWRLFSRNGFYTLHSTQSDDQQYIMTVSRVKAE
jgi:uncharacterized SAM-dependent methyltransferase/transposase